MKGINSGIRRSGIVNGLYVETEKRRTTVGITEAAPFRHAFPTKNQVQRLEAGVHPRRKKQKRNSAAVERDADVSASPPLKEMRLVKFRTSSQMGWRGRS